MSTKKLSKAAREYLLTRRRPRPVVVDCWGIQTTASGTEEVRFFRMAVDRRVWVAQNPKTRRAVGKRHPAVKAFRTREAQELKHRRERMRLRVESVADVLLEVE